MFRLAGVVLLFCVLLAPSAAAQVAVEKPFVAWDSGPGNWDATKSIPVSGDFDGDGKTDIAAFYDNGANNLRVWIFRGNGSPGSVGVAAPAVAFDSAPGGWHAPFGKYVAGDFDADGKDDLAAFYEYGGAQTKLWVWRSTGGGQFAGGVVSWDSQPGNWEWGRTKLVAGDFDGNGRDEIGAFHAYDGSSTRLFAFRFTGPPGSVANVTQTAPWESSPGGWDGNRSTPFAGDGDGDGKTDVAMFYDYGGALTRLWVLRGTGTAPQIAFDTGKIAWDSGGGRWDAGRMKPFSGDFDADGKIDLGALYDLGGGTTDMHVLRATGAAEVAGPAAVWNSGPGSWGWDKTQPVSGDFDGDGRTDVGAFYRYDGAQTRLWLFRTRESDRDGDGFVDSGDQCPDQHRGQFDADADGCPDDGDHDGVLAGTDCNDANAAIRPGAVDVPVDGVDQDCTRGDAPYPRIASPIDHLWAPGRTRARVKMLRVREVPAGASVELRCTPPRRGSRRLRRRACEIRRRSFTPDRRAIVDLKRRLHRPIPVGTVLEVRVTGPAMVGKVLRFTVRPRRLPSRKPLCIAPGASAPAAVC